MINLCSGIVIRYCLDRAFLINIYTNKVLTLSVKAIDYLLCEIENGLNKYSQVMENQEFVNMVSILINEGILEEISDEL